ncbi:hypothetical protein ACTFIZ_006234 [Dictyostelium cf. discoideum]
MENKTQIVKVVGYSKTIVKAFGKYFLILNKETVQKLYIYIYSQLKNQNNMKSVNKIYVECIEDFNITYGFCNKYKVSYLSGRIAPPRSFAKEPSRMLINDDDFKTVIDSMYKCLGSDKPTNPAKLENIFDNSPYGWFTCKKSCIEYFESISDTKCDDSDESDDSEDYDSDDSGEVCFKIDDEDSNDETISDGFKKVLETTPLKKRKNSNDEDISFLDCKEEFLPSLGIGNSKKKISKISTLTSKTTPTPKTATKNPISPSSPPPTTSTTTPPTTTTTTTTTTAAYSNSIAVSSNTTAFSNTTSPSFVSRKILNPSISTGSSSSYLAGEEALNLKKDIEELKDKMLLIYDALRYFINNNTISNGEINKKLDKIKF